MMESRHAQRKNEHLSLAAKYYDQVHQHHYFDQVRLIHDSLPEMTTDDVDLHVQLADNLEIECPCKNIIKPIKKPSIHYS